jgi:AbiTii
VSLLEEIQIAAVDASSDLGTLLRKCKLLAVRLGSKPLEDWLIWESNGYPDDVKVPEYRVWPLEVKGHFSGPFGSGMRNAPIPSALLPQRVRDQYERYECRQSIASIEAILTKTNDGTVQVNTGDLALVLGMKVYERLNCVQAWAEFSTGHLVELLNSVRNRVLDFALAVWKEEPAAGETSAKGATSVDSSRVTQIFNTTVYGGPAQVVGTATNSTIAITISRMDFSSLERILRDNGVGDSEVAELRVALESEAELAPQASFGPKVSSWIGGMIRKAADGSWGVGVGAAGNLLAQAIGKYYGL